MSEDPNALKQVLQSYQSAIDVQQRLLEQQSQEIKRIKASLEPHSSSDVRPAPRSMRMLLCSHTQHRICIPQCVSLTRLFTRAVYCDVNPQDGDTVDADKCDHGKRNTHVPAGVKSGAVAPRIGYPGGMTEYGGILLLG
jgi:hypothetical protein